MSPASGPVNDSKMFPAATLDDQEAILMSDGNERTVMGSPPFSSPNPATDARRMLPLEDGTSAHQTAVEAAEGREKASAEDYDSMKVPALRKLVEERDLEPESNKKEHLVAALREDDASGMKAADFKKQVGEATTQEELDQVAELYEASGKSYSSVEAAIEAKQTEIDEASTEEENGDDDNSNS